MMIKNISFLFDEHDGSEGLEAVIVSPLMFGTFFMLLYFFFMSLTFIAYNNIATNVAHELNMRQTGYDEAVATFTTAPKILTFRNSTADTGIPASAYLPASSIIVTPLTPELRAGAWFALNKYKDQIAIPFSQVTSIEVESLRSVDSAQGDAMAGNVIRVKIHYNTMSIGDVGRALIDMTAVGYGIIS